MELWGYDMEVQMADTSSNPMPRLYERLRDAGYAEGFVREKVLPSWWSDEAAGTSAGLSQVLLLLARRLGLDYAALRDDAAALVAASGPAFKLKKSTANLDARAVATTARVATHVARLVAHAAPAATVPWLNRAADIRKAILATRACVDLAGLIDHCWNSGIVVLHLEFPKARQLHGLAVRVAGAPVVVLFDGRKPTAWSLFVLAHELGHLALGHLAEDGVLVDEQIDEGSVDAEELAANRFAIEVLTGAPDWHPDASGRWPNAVGLAESARRLGASRRIDPGHVVLNFGRHVQTNGAPAWGLVGAALKHIDPEGDGPVLVRRALVERLRWDELNDDAREYVERLARVESP